MESNQNLPSLNDEIQQRYQQIAPIIVRAGRQCKYQTKEEATEIVKQQRKQFQLKYAQQRRDFKSQAKDSQILLIKRLQSIIIPSEIEIYQIHEILNKYDQNLNKNNECLEQENENI